MIVFGTWFGVKNNKKEKKTKTHRKTKFLPTFKGRNNKFIIGWTHEIETNLSNGSVSFFSS